MTLVSTRLNPPYAQPEDFYALALPQIATSRKFSNADVLYYCCVGADVCDSAIRSQYPGLPLVSWGSDLTLANVQVSGLLLIQNRGGNAGDQSVYMMAKDANDAARQWLDQVATGSRSLSVVQTQPAAGFQASITSRPQRGF